MLGSLIKKCDSERICVKQIRNNSSPEKSALQLKIPFRYPFLVDPLFEIFLSLKFHFCAARNIFAYLRKYFFCLEDCTSLLSQSIFSFPL